LPSPFGRGFGEGLSDHPDVIVDIEVLQSSP
jgi:hypothetical protein